SLDGATIRTADSRFFGRRWAGIPFTDVAKQRIGVTGMPRAESLRLRANGATHHIRDRDTTIAKTTDQSRVVIPQPDVQQTHGASVKIRRLYGNAPALDADKPGVTAGRRAGWPRRRRPRRSRSG